MCPPQAVTVDASPGRTVCVWAPKRKCSVVGDFRPGTVAPPWLRREAGARNLVPSRACIPAPTYEYELLGPDGAALPLKSDPLATATEMPPDDRIPLIDSFPERRPGS